MYSLEELFRNTKHSSYIFSPEEINAVEEAVVLKGSIPYIKCIIRKKDVKLTPEEAVRQLYVRRLMHSYGYDETQIKLEHTIHFGHEIKRADIAIFEKEHPTSEYIIVEVKKPKLTEGKEQLRSYCNATGAIIGVWTNGEEISYYHRKEPNHFENIPDIPNTTQQLKDILTERWSIDDLAKHNRLHDGKKTLKALIQEMENEVLANAGVDAFEEIFKLIYTKLYDEFQSTRDNTRFLEFRNYGYTDSELKTTIDGLFEMAKFRWPGIFAADSSVMLSASHLAVCVSSLQDVKLFNSNLDVIDDAFEYLMTKSRKGDKGQFFTPRYVIDMCVKMLNPSRHETMIDTAAGSGGFPIHTMFYVWKQIINDMGLPQSHLFTAEVKPDECEIYVNEKIFSIDFDEKIVRVARTINLIAGDGKSNVLHLNTLDYDRWEEVIQSEEWRDSCQQGWHNLRALRANKRNNRDFMLDIVMGNPPFAGEVKESKILARYDLARDARGRLADKVGRDILFIERNLQFLKPGGRMALILPQGRFNNSSDKYIREFISDRCRILAVIGLHENVFKPHTGTKTSVLLVQKWDEELCPYREDYPIFCAVMKKPTKDNSGEKIYRKNADGSVMLDYHGHEIVDHDLFNHEGMTEDGIAEAFIEFAKREELSFFARARRWRPFDEEHYKALTGGLQIGEVMLSDVLTITDYFRLEAEYYTTEKSSLAVTLKGSEIVEKIQYGTSKLCDEDSSGYPVLRLNELDNAFIGTPEKFCHIMSETEFQSLCLKKGDVLVVRTNGNPNLVGRSAVVMEDTDIAFASYMYRLMLNGTINPCTTVAFMNGKYGRLEIDRLSLKGNQTNFSPAKFRDMEFPVFSRKLQDKIQEIFTLAYSYRSEANTLYAEAKNLLADKLNFSPSTISQKNIATPSLSAFINSERWDAEYFMPKYDDILAGFSDAKTVDELCTIHKANFTPQAGTEYRYVELADIGTYGDITGATIADGADLPTRARRIVHTGQVIVSSIEGSMQSCAMVTPEYDGALCSTGFYVADSNNYNPETLLMLFKSQPVQELMKRGCTGMILASISERELNRVKLPHVDDTTQSTIASKIQQSFKLRHQSEDLIAQAIKSVELAIEQGEHEAFEFLCG